MGTERESSQLRAGRGGKVILSMTLYDGTKQPGCASITSSTFNVDVDLRRAGRVVFILLNLRLREDTRPKEESLQSRHKNIINLSLFFSNRTTCELCNQFSS
jgi:hypothetical protein